MADRWLDPLDGDAMAAAALLDQLGLLEVRDGKMFPSERGVRAFFRAFARDELVRAFVLESVGGGELESQALVLNTMLVFAAEDAAARLLAAHDEGGPEDERRGMRDLVDLFPGRGGVASGRGAGRPRA